MNYQENSISEKIERDFSKFETIRQLARRHMRDQYHTTTDEEIKNAVVEYEIHHFKEYNFATTLVK
jgi:hypothetical protein